VSPTHGERVEVLLQLLCVGSVSSWRLEPHDNTSFASREKSRDSSPSAIIV